MFIQVLLAASAYVLKKRVQLSEREPPVCDNGNQQNIQHGWHPGWHLFLLLRRRPSRHLTVVPSWRSRRRLPMAPRRRPSQHLPVAPSQQPKWYRFQPLRPTAASVPLAASLPLLPASRESQPSPSPASSGSQPTPLWLVSRGKKPSAFTASHLIGHCPTSQPRRSPPQSEVATLSFVLFWLAFVSRSLFLLYSFGFYNKAQFLLPFLNT